MNDRQKLSLSGPRDSAPVPAGRGSRLAKMGALAGRIAGNVLVESGRQLARGQKPVVSELLLTPANVGQVADKLATMRGAAMKVGQLLSMDAGNLLPDDLAEILARLRSDAVTMPTTQLLQVLEQNRGEDWQTPFTQFSFNPVAAASIGQVHEARTEDGRHLALKIQYPGVRQSIDSDIDNVVSLLRLTGLIPKGLDLDPLLDEARRQLRREADYLQEGMYMTEYARYLQRLDWHDELAVPRFHADLSSEQILAMDWLDGIPLEHLAREAPRQRSHVMARLLQLFFAELYDFRYIQTDPNLANYRYQPDSQRIVLLDFGAVRAFPDTFVQQYKQAMQAAVREDRNALDEALQASGFFRQGLEVANRDVILDIFLLAAEPLRHKGVYDFGKADLAQRIQARGMSVSRDPDAWHTPPPDVLFLHRKMGGLYMMAAKLGAKVNAAELFEPWA
ncbi:MAG: AarF/ABC1/UbiB kinase family protein [Marinobacterium sp.]|nr:AarF/ABC1/UbiB kinase family protein [Marinobacterium sp.]